MSRNDDLERRRGEYEEGRLVRDVISIPAAAAVGLLVGVGPIGAAVGGVAAGAKAIADKLRRDREWEGR